MAGKGLLVGAGPGDPGLITVKGLRCLGQAQVVVYDRLMDPSLLEAAPESAERVFVGKERGRQALTQDQINRLLVDRAAEGKVVVRLKGGDPFVFGRGGEEALALAEQDIPFEVVPGITSAIAAAAYAGIPVTHRRVSSLFTVVSGSEDPTKPESTVPWEVLARTGGTLVVLMGWAPLQSILQTLAEEGMPKSTPVALIHWGTWTQQRTVTGCLEDIVAQGKEAGLKPPVVAVIGPVVDLREGIRWFDRADSPGKRVLITRSRTQASKLGELLEQAGAQPVELPSIEIAPLEDYQELDRELEQFWTGGAEQESRWVIFSSTNAVEAVFARLAAQGKDARAFANATIGAIGPATAQALAQQGIRADFVPASSPSEAVVAELSDRDWNGVPVLLPGADIGREVLVEGLAGLGAQVRRVTAYRTVTPSGASDRARQLLQEGVDVVTFTSSSTVRNLMELLGDDQKLLASSLIACIGPVTAATAAELGLRVDLVAKDATVEGLVEALASHWQGEPASQRDLKV